LAGNKVQADDGVDLKAERRRQGRRFDRDLGRRIFEEGSSLSVTTAKPEPSSIRIVKCLR